MTSRVYQGLPSPQRRLRPARMWRLLVWMACAAVLYGAYAYLGGSAGLIQYGRLYLKKSRVEKEINLLEARQDSLRQVIDLLQNDLTYIEKIARERYYMGRPGETIYTVVKQPASE